MYLVKIREQSCILVEDFLFKGRASRGGGRLGSGFSHCVERKGFQGGKDGRFGCEFISDYV